MEYLVTYGWALLALFAVVAFLATSGAFSSSNFSVPECTFQPDLPCSSFILYKPASGEATLQFEITNNLGFPISITNITYMANDLGQQGQNTYSGTLPSTRRIDQGDKLAPSHNFSGPRQPQQKDFKTIYVSIEYQNCRFSPCGGNYTISGRIAAPVEAS